MSKICAKSWRTMIVSLSVLTGSFLVTCVNAQSTERPFSYSLDTPQAKAVTKVREAMQKGQWDIVPALARQTRGDPLALYVDFWMAQRAVKQARSTQQVPEADAFLARYPDSYMADRLRAEWVLAAAEAGDFKTIEALGDFPWMNNQVRCAKLEARHMNGQRAQAPEVIEVFAADRACWSMMDQMVADGVVGRKALVPLMLNAIESNYTGSATRFAGYLMSPADLQVYKNMMAGPAKWLKAQKAGRLSEDKALITAVALARVARDNAATALTEAETVWAKQLPKELYGWVLAQVALRDALNLQMDRADRLYRQAGMIDLSTTNYEWRVRAALRQPKVDWKWVAKAIDAMPTALRNDTTWQYWKARAFAAQGDEDAARQLYERVAASGDHGFYAQLAAEELGRQITAPEPPSAVTAEELQQARDNPHLQQAVALFRQGWRPEAVPQWNYGLRGLNDRQLLAAAEFAREQQIYDRVVNTSERTRQHVDFSQRFIAPFEKQVSAQARSISLDPAWVYGLIRQESRFVMDARSVAGASGLMQLMPGTAKQVAKQIGMTDFHPSRVNEFEVNTILGTNYMMMVLQNLDQSLVLASAGYNAGPGRPIRWRATLSQPVEGAIFAETIPFTETRHYVKNVLSNATNYAALFTGEPQSLKERLGVVRPKQP